LSWKLSIRHPVALLLALLLALGLALPAVAAAGATPQPHERLPVETGKGPATGLPVPRFVSLGADRVNVRAGPGDRYPIVWQFVRRGLPVEITAEFEHWRRIRDQDGAEGWVHKTLLSGRRYAVVAGGVRSFHDEPDQNSAIVMQAEPGVQGRLLACKDRWCRMEIDGRRGWLPRTQLWGVYSDEVIE
jgi:SH3-like domain-containing protein